MPRGIQDRFEIIATVGPATLTGSYLDPLVKAGVTIFRLNGSHIPIRILSTAIDDIRAEVGGRAQLMLDLPGNKVRTKDIGEPIRLRKSEVFTLGHDQVTHPDFLRALKPGCGVIAADGLLRFHVERQLRDYTVFFSHSDGLLGDGRGLHVREAPPVGPFLSSLDRQLLKLATAKGVDFVSLSYVCTAKDVLEARGLLPDRSGVRLIVKVETEAAYDNLDELLDVSTHILIDRGDLASAIGIDNIPTAQRLIIRRARARGLSVFLATQFLQNMVEQPIPLIAEVDSVYAAVASGVQGLQLSAETAVGKHPLAAVSVVAAQIERARAEGTLRSSPARVVWLLGLSGSGKTTLAERLRRALAGEYGFQTELLDGDAVRAQDPVGLGYSRADREANIQRIINLAKLLSRNNVTTIVANISPYQHLRDRARAEIPGYLEVYLECPVEVCVRRDPKELYARAARGEADHVIGVSEPFEPPLGPDLVVNTAQTTEEEAVQQILGCMLEWWPAGPSVSG